MKYQGEKKYLYWGITAFLVICASILFYYIIFHWDDVTSLFNHFFKIIMPIIMGAVLAYILAPVTNYIENIIFNKIGKKHKFLHHEKRGIRVLSLLLTYLLFGTILYGFFQLVFPEIYSSILNISIQFPTYMDNFQKFLEKILQKNPELENLVTNLMEQYNDVIYDWINKTLLPKATSLFMAMTNGVFVALKTTLNLIIGIIVSIYLINNKELFKGQAKKIVYALMNRETANAFIYNMRFTNKTFNGFISGKIVDSILMGIICFGLTQILKIPYGVLISVIVGVTNLIPFFGPFIGAIPSALLVLVVEPPKFLPFIIMVFALQQFDGNILGPKILGNSTGISGFWVIFAITLFGGIFGVVGMLIGVPVFAVLYAGFRAFIKTKLEEKNMLWDTRRYIDVDYINDDNEFIDISKDEIKDVKSKEKLQKMKERLKFERTVHHNAAPEKEKEQAPEKKAGADDTMNTAQDAKKGKNKKS